MERDFVPLSEDAAATPPDAVTIRVDGHEVSSPAGRPVVESLTPTDGSDPDF